MVGPPAKRNKKSRSPGERQAEQIALAEASDLADDTLALLKATAERIERFKGVQMLGCRGGAAGCTTLATGEVSGHGEAGDGRAAAVRGAASVRVQARQWQHSCELREALAAFATRYSNSVSDWYASAIDELAMALPAPVGNRGHQARVANVLHLWNLGRMAATTQWLAGIQKKPFAPSAKLFKKLTSAVLAHGLMQGSHGERSVELALAAWHLWTRRGSPARGASLDLPRSVSSLAVRWPRWLALLAPEARDKQVATMARTPMSAHWAAQLRREVATHGPPEGIAQWIEAAAQRPAHAQDMLRGLALDGVPDVREELMLSVAAAGGGTRVSWKRDRFCVDYHLQVRILECLDREKAQAIVVGERRVTDSDGGGGSSAESAPMRLEPSSMHLAYLKLDELAGWLRSGKVCQVLGEDGGEIGAGGGLDDGGRMAVVDNAPPQTSRWCRGRRPLSVWAWRKSTPTPMWMGTTATPSPRGALLWPATTAAPSRARGTMTTTRGGARARTVCMATLSGSVLRACSLSARTSLTLWARGRCAGISRSSRKNWSVQGRHLTICCRSSVARWLTTLTRRCM